MQIPSAYIVIVLDRIEMDSLKIIVLGTWPSIAVMNDSKSKSLDNTLKLQLVNSKRFTKTDAAMNQRTSIILYSLYREGRLSGYL
jgi:hypothetical protein